MLLIRPVQMRDIEQLLSISHAVGRGMTSMPADELAWREKITASVRAFSRQGGADESSTYFMVLEDHATGRVAGTTAIYSGIGLDKPFYSYKLSTLVSRSSDLALTRKAQVLSMVNDYTGATEIGSLFVLPEFRKPGVGQFLSRARYLALADFPERFSELVMAELRGWQDEQGRSPLWEHLGRNFFGIDFQEAVNTAALKGPQFISDLMPKYPIYVDLLPQRARDVIGKPHCSSAPALHLLQKEGFQFSGYVDLFDGGPTVQASACDIRTVRNSCSARCRVVAHDQSPHALDAGMMMLSNGCLTAYRIALAPAYHDAQGGLCIDSATAEALKISSGAELRYIDFGDAGSLKQTIAA